MKYIESPLLAALAKKLNYDGQECSVHTRIEAYSCKDIKRDKKLYRALESAYQDEASHSPPIPSWVEEIDITPFGPFDKHNSRKTLYLLISTLNNAFPDYDFSDVRPSQFSKEESGASVLNALSTTLRMASSPSSGGTVDEPRTYAAYPPNAELFPSSVPTSSSPYDSIIRSPYAPAPIVSGTHPDIYRLLDDMIGLPECDVYSYVPDIEADPHANAFSDDEDDFASIGDDDSSEYGDDLFDFDNYDDDLDEVHNGGRSRRQAGGIFPPPTPRKAYSIDSSFTSSSSPGSYYGPVRMKRRGPLLWSSHWFFINRKQKRILFISICSRSKRPSWYAGGEYDSWRSAVDDSLETSRSLEATERFLGWENSAGLGARSMGLAGKL